MPPRDLHTLKSIYYPRNDWLTRFWNKLGLNNWSKILIGSCQTLFQGPAVRRHCVFWFHCWLSVGTLWWLFRLPCGALERDFSLSFDTSLQRNCAKEKKFVQCWTNNVTFSSLGIRCSSQSTPKVLWWIFGKLPFCDISRICYWLRDVIHSKLRLQTLWKETLHMKRQKFAFQKWNGFKRQMSSYDWLNVALYRLTSLSFICDIEICILNGHFHWKATSSFSVFLPVQSTAFTTFLFLMWNVLCPIFYVNCLVRNTRLAVTQLF